MRYYSSIDDLPIYYYWKVINEKSLDYLIIEKDNSMPETTKNIKLQMAWDNISDEMIAIQLKDPSFVAGLKSEMRHYLKQVKALTEPTALNKLMFEVAEESKKEESFMKMFDYNNSIALLEEHLKFFVDDKKMSVSRYFAHMQRMVNLSKRKKEQ